MTARRELPLSNSPGLNLPPSLTPLGLATLVTRAIQCQDLRMRAGRAEGEGGREGLREEVSGGDAAPSIARLRAALNELQDVMAQVLMRAPLMIQHPDYGRLATDLRDTLLATMRDPLDRAEVPGLHSGVTSASTTLTVMVVRTE